MKAHNAFHIEPVLKKSQLKITTLDIWGQRVLVGTEEGALLVLEEQAGAHIVEFDIIDTRRTFSKRPLLQISVVEKLGILLSLSSELMQVNDLASLDMRAQLLKTRGATDFAFTMELEPPVLCCAVRKTLVFYRWDGQLFSDWKEINVADVPRGLQWCGDSLCMSIGRKYHLINVFSGADKTLFDSNSANPTIFRLPAKKELLLGRDNISVFQDFEGRPSRKYAITWSDAPVSCVCSPPFLLGILPKVVEVQLMETQMVMQSMSLRATHVVAGADGAVLVVANNCIYRLRPVPMARQVESLMEAREYEAGLALCDLCADDPAVAARAPPMHHALGHSLFAAADFDKAMSHFTRGRLDPRAVLCLFPDLRVPDYEPPPRPEGAPPPPDLKGHTLLRAQVALIKFLNAFRRRSRAAAAAASAGGAPAAAGAPAGEPAGLDAVVDTALLRVLLRAEPENVLELLQGDHAVDLAEGERLLADNDMPHELVALYHSRGQHRRALELLMRHGQGPQEEHPLHGPAATVEYLQRLGPEDEPLILEFSRWVLRADPAMGLAIFTGKLPGEPAAAAAGGVPGAGIVAGIVSADGGAAAAAGAAAGGGGGGGSSRARLGIETVLGHLKAFDGDNRDKGDAVPCLRIEYLEHVIAAGEAGPAQHNELVLLYLDAVQRLKHALAARQAGQLVPPVRYAAGAEPGALGAMRRKLLGFLATSTGYSADKMLSKLPLVDLYEERALILSCLGQHQAALSIYAHRLGDCQMAQDYCEKRYNPDDPATKQVYLDLLKVYLKPPDASAPMTMQALSLMSKYFERMDPAQALDLLPQKTGLKSLQPFFESVIRHNSQHRKSLQISKSLLKAENLKVSLEHHEALSRRVVITPGRKCKVSDKRIGTSAFLVYPNNVTVLLGEKTHDHICPVTGRDFLAEAAGP